MGHTNIWITDLVAECERDDEYVTEDRKLKNLKLNRQGILTGLETSSINKIYFTSGFGKNNAAKLFVDLFNIEYKLSYNEETREFLIPKKHFGRHITGVVLFSPSGQANIGVSKSRAYLKDIEKYRLSTRPVKEFKIDFYRNKFDFLKIKTVDKIMNLEI